MLSVSSMGRSTVLMVLPLQECNSNADGTVRRWFNRFGSVPTVTNPAAGEYEVAFPGLEGDLGARAIVIATDADSPPRHVRHFLPGSNDLVTLRTYDLTGAAANGDVNLVVMAPNSASAASASDSISDELDEWLRAERSLIKATNLADKSTAA
jgi:hypothetical protein